MILSRWVAACLALVLLGSGPRTRSAGEKPARLAASNG